MYMANSCAITRYCSEPQKILIKTNMMVDWSAFLFCVLAVTEIPMLFPQVYTRH